MHIEFHGAADEVTGSLHRLHVNGKDILLDCGLFQGRRAEANSKNRNLPRWATEAHCVVLSHAHLDHSGNIPTLVKRGYSGNIYCTPCTRDLCSVMLRDSAMIQEQDARYINRRNKRDGIKEEPVEPLYDSEDALKAVSQMVSIGLHRPIEISPGVTLRFFNAGHVLGSSLVCLDLEEKGKKRRLLFTGDLGRAELPLLQPPEIVADVDVLMTESTYGDRRHREFASTDEKLGTIIRETIDRKGRVFIPTFALERAQEVLFSLERLHEANQLPDVPIYIDSPLAISVTEIYKLHPESLSTEVQERLLARNDPFSPPNLRYVSEVDESKSIQNSSESCIVIAGSGMCEGGRIVFHLREGLEDPRNSVVIVGFMAQHTLGRRLIEGRTQVNVFGVPRDVRAHIHVLNGLSAHADQDDILSFVQETSKAGRLRTVVLVHGEEGAKEELGQLLESAGISSIVKSKKKAQVEL